MSLEEISLLITAFINFILACVVYFKNQRQLINKLFAFFVFSFVGWILSLLAIKLTFETTINLLWGRLPFAFASLIPLSFLCFVKAFPNRKTINFKRNLLVFVFLGLTFSLLSFSPWIITRIEYTDAEQHPIYGPVYPLFVSYFLFCLGYGFLALVRKWRKSERHNKIQIQYVLLGVAIALFGGAISNLIIPFLFRSSRFSFYGPYFSIILFGFIAHAIIRYRLMDIKAVISKSMVYILSSAIAIGILLGLFLLIRRFVPIDINIPKEALIVTTALSSIIVFFPLKSLFQFFLNKYFYREPYDYQRILRNASQALSVLQFRELLDYLTGMIVDEMKVESASIFLEEEGIFQRQSIERYFDSDDEDKDSELTNIQRLSEEESYVIQELQRRMERGPDIEKFLVREELARQLGDSKAQKISEELSSLKHDVVFPLTFEDQLIGVFFVGAKLSGDPYFQPDLDLLSTVSNQAAIAIRNAQLYTEVNWMRKYNENILHEMESGVITVDNNGVITIFNETAEELLGIDKEETIGKEVEVLGSKISGLILDALYHNKLSSQNEITITTQDGREIPIIFSTSCFKHEQEEISDCIMVFSDLSEVKETEEKRQKLQRLALLGNVASGILHEVKNSLMPLRTFAELLPKNYSDPEFRDNYSKIVLDEMDQVNSLVNQLRDLTQFSQNNFSPVKVQSPIENALSLLKVETEKSEIQVTTDYAQELPEIMGDENELRQLFLNLFINSLEFMSDGGELHIKTFVQKLLNSKSVFVEISDKGPGIAEEDLEKIFDPFFTTREEGTGLGLTICQSIVDAHGGNIEMRNNEKEGVTVTVSFPIPKRC